MDEFPLHAWRYHMRLRIDGADRLNLRDCLEGEDLALFHYLPREEVYEQIAEGEITFARTFMDPFQAFPDDLAALSAYLFQIVKAIELCERYVSRTETDDVRAWKIVARQGEWVKVPLVVSFQEEGRFLIDEDADDTDVLSARWDSYPAWFQDGMRLKHPVLRDL